MVLILYMMFYLKLFQIIHERVHARHRGEHCALFQKIKVHRFLREERLGLRPKPCQKPEVSGLPSYCFAVYREAMWKVSGTQFLTGAWGRAPT